MNKFSHTYFVISLAVGRARPDYNQLTLILNDYYHRTILTFLVKNLMVDAI